LPGRLSSARARAGLIRECARIALQVIDDSQSLTRHQDLIVISVQNIVQTVTQQEPSEKIARSSPDTQLLDLLSRPQVESVIHYLNENQVSELWTYCSFTSTIQHRHRLPQDSLEHIKLYSRVCLTLSAHPSPTVRQSVLRDGSYLIKKHLEWCSDSRQAAMMLDAITYFANHPRITLEALATVLVAVSNSKRRLRFGWATILGQDLMSRLSQIPDNAPDRESWIACISAARQLESDPPLRSWTSIDRAVEVASTQFRIKAPPSLEQVDHQGSEAGRRKEI
jgi:hypothetical protein